MNWLALTVPGLLVAVYLLVLRPVLHALPQLKTFYAEADGFWEKVWALNWNSLTIAWSYFMAAVGFGLDWLEPVASALGDPDFKAQLADMLQAEPKTLGWVLMGISAVNIAARLRSFATKADQ